MREEVGAGTDDGSLLDPPVLHVREDTKNMKSASGRERQDEDGWQKRRGGDKGG